MLQFEHNCLFFFDYKRGNCSVWAGLVIVCRVLGVIFLGFFWKAIVVHVCLLSCFQSPSVLDTLLCRLAEQLAYQALHTGQSRWAAVGVCVGRRGFISGTSKEPGVYRLLLLKSKLSQIFQQARVWVAIIVSLAFVCSYFFADGCVHIFSPSPHAVRPIQLRQNPHHTDKTTH